MYAPGIKWDSFFQDATSWRQYQGGPALAITSGFTWRQKIFGARMSESSFFPKSLFSVFNPYSKELEVY